MSYSPIVIEQTARGEREYQCCLEGLRQTLPRAGRAGRGSPSQLRYASLAISPLPSTGTPTCRPFSEA